MTSAVTPAEQVERVLAALADMRAKCEAASEWEWYGDGDGDLKLLDPYDAAFVIAASPAVLLRLTDYAEGVLDRHRHRIRNGENWCGAHSHWPCPEITAVIQAWLPWQP